MPGADIPGVHYLRTFTDVEQIRESAQPGRRAVIVGGGYIGLETSLPPCVRSDWTSPFSRPPTGCSNGSPPRRSRRSTSASTATRE
ncbi:FAD-dependent oxidoreductase [Nocardioides convexus]|uniref:FAD-dependent oxidoreductase n=1 Tax=Nocardioides convexus TaxID=2712224 RepID=UPI0024183603|nr:FAD-dependent oxidoreductase [Nocardioides convexus]